MRKITGFVRRIVREEDGQSLVEYGLIIALIAVVVIAALVLLGPDIKNLFMGVSNTLTNTAG